MEHTHIIHKVVIEVSVNNRKKAYAIKDDISSFLTMDVFPKLEKHLATVQAQIPTHTLQISRLVVDINHRESSLNTTLKNDIITSFRKELAEIIKNGSVQHLNPYLSQRRNQSLNQRYNPTHSKDQHHTQSQKQIDNQNQFGDQNQDYKQNGSEKHRQNDGQNQSHRQNQNHGQNPNPNPNYDQDQPDGPNQSHRQHQDQSQSHTQDQRQNQNQNQNRPQDQSYSQNSWNAQNQHPSQNPHYGQNHTENPRYGDEHDYNTNQYYDATENPEIHFLDETEKLLRTFIHFIEEGTMPWWNTNETSAAIFESIPFKKIISEKAFVAKIVFSIQKPKVRERIINQFTDTQIAQICLAVIQTKGLKIALKSAVIKQLSGSSFADRKVLWSLILQTISILASNKVANPETHTIEQITKTIPLLKAAKNQETEEQIWNDINAIFPFIEQQIPYSTFRERNNKTSNKTAKSDKKNPHKEESEKTDRNKTTPALFQTAQQETPFGDEVSNDHQVQNAGLVLIHPFIVNLFKHCHLMDSKTNTLTDPETGIHLLHYIATGKTNQPESAMLFEKHLCNVPLHQSINRHVKLTRKQKTEAAKVIGAVQQNWSAMKTASVGLLQHEFFQRPGKLTLDSQTLTVERKTQDILMDKLSWGISMIRLPWQTQFMYVNW